MARFGHCNSDGVQFAQWPDFKVLGLCGAPFGPTLLTIQVLIRM